MSELDSLSNLFNGDGEVMTGSPMTDEQALNFMRDLRLNTEYCLVRDWIWIDLNVTPAQLAELGKTRRQPAVIFAHSVIYDSAKCWDVGNLVRTSPLHEFRNGFLFQTLNSVYVLLGDGLRKRAAVDTVGQIDGSTSVTASGLSASTAETHLHTQKQWQEASAGDSNDAGSCDAGAVETGT